MKNVKYMINTYSFKIKREINRMWSTEICQRFPLLFRSLKTMFFKIILIVCL